MSEHKKREQTVMLILSSLGLFGLLAYTFWHTGGLLARYITPWIFGYVAAFGIEATIAGMSYRLASLRKSKQYNGFLTFTLVAALLVSAFANVEEGYQARYNKPLTLANIPDIDLIQAFIGLSATGLISLLVFAISEIVGSDVNVVAKVSERPRKQTESAEQKTTEQPGPELLALPAPVNTDYKQAVYSVLASGEQLGPRPMAERVGCSPATAKKWIDSYEGERAILAHANGKGER